MKSINKARSFSNDPNICYCEENKFFNCVICDYTTPHKCNMIKHIDTKSHILKTQVKSIKSSLSIKKYQCSEKTGEFYCDICDYYTSYKTNIKKHISAKGHRANFDVFIQKTSHELAKNEKKYKNENNIKYVCDSCNYETYKLCNIKRHYNSIRHMENAKNNKLTENVIIEENNTNKECSSDMILYDNYSENENKYENLTTSHQEYVELKTKAKRVDRLEKIVETLLEQNNKLTDSIKNTMESQNSVICDMAKQPQNIQNNNSFNLTNYLNIECKDAPNLSDFINNVKVSYDDLLKIRNNGYIYGMEKNLIDELINLEDTKRPIQCTDGKRKKFFIKDQEKWDIDNDNKRLNQALNEITTKHINELQQWKIRNPDWMDNDTKFDVITDITCQILRGSSSNGDKLKKKIYDKLSKAVKVKK